MKLILLGTIKVKDSEGNVWEVGRADVKQGRTRYSDYQGADIFNPAWYAETPDGVRLLVPPVAEWKAGKTYDGVLSHPYGSLVWA